MSRNVRSVNGQPPINAAAFPVTERRTDRKQQMENKANRTILVNCVLVFCMASGILTTSVVIHLGIENYNRLQECRELRREIEFLKWKLGVGENFTKWREEMERQFAYENMETDVLPNQTKSIPTTVTESTVTLGTINYKFSTEKQRRTQKQRTAATAKQHKKRIMMSQPIKDGRRLNDDGKRAQFSVQEEISVSAINLLVRHSMARIRDIEESQRRFDVSQEFMREQVNQRLAMIETFIGKDEEQNNEKFTFLAYLSSDVSFHHSRNPHSSTPLLFNRLALNEGNGFESLFGHFACPRNGVYVFHLTLSVTSNVVKDNDHVETNVFPYDDSRSCVANIRKNGATVMTAQENIPGRAYEYGYTNYDENNNATIATVLVTRLKADEVIDVTMNTNPSCVVIGCPHLCSTFQGYFLHD